MDSNLLAVRAGAGDIAAFEELVRLHQNQVFSIALRMSGNREDALDISQETFVRVWRALPQFNSESKFSTWLYRIVSNICTDFYRKNSRMQTVSITTSDDEGEDTQLELPDEKHSPERSVENDELSDALDKLCELGHLTQTAQGYQVTPSGRDAICRMSSLRILEAIRKALKWEHIKAPM